MQRELDYLGKAIDSGPEPRIALLGGSKAADSVKIAKNFIDKGIIQDKGDCKKILKTKNKAFKSFISGADFKQ